jgi:hypothetical protein
MFPLPGLDARKQILSIHTRKWAAPPADRLVCELASLAVGYCGADLKALCAEASLHALRRRWACVCVARHGIRYRSVYRIRRRRGVYIPSAAENVCALKAVTFAILHGSQRFEMHWKASDKAYPEHSVDVAAVKKIMWWCHTTTLLSMCACVRRVCVCARVCVCVCVECVYHPYVSGCHPLRERARLCFLTTKHCKLSF